MLRKFTQYPLKGCLGRSYIYIYIYIYIYAFLLQPKLALFAIWAYFPRPYAHLTTPNIDSNLFASFVAIACDMIWMVKYKAFGRSCYNPLSSKSPIQDSNALQPKYLKGQ
jgi:glucan phosphoethanolaminetransferase (alkaline phosphatase superfamily)